MTTRILAALLATCALPALAQVETRTITVSNGVAETHPVADGIDAMQACFDRETDGGLGRSAPTGRARSATTSTRPRRYARALRRWWSPPPRPSLASSPPWASSTCPSSSPTRREADAILDGEVGQMISERMEAHGLVNLAWWENGFRNLTNSCAP
jgi:TRAP-type C4-dicarboxylate transport system substrate-binding protein